ncbi:MAG: hypothetical protein II741_04870 [Lachnospiraceae bacterium]|nr:hypothetical protein [Lachnospiraceae bacterium]
MILSKSRGSVTNIVTLFIFIVGMTVVMLAFYDCIGLLKTREEISQIVRRYILVAETEGYLSNDERLKMTEELKLAGLTEIDLTGTTFTGAGYGNLVNVKVSGKVTSKLGGPFEVVEERASTAKY